MGARWGGGCGGLVPHLLDDPRNGCLDAFRWHARLERLTLISVLPAFSSLPSRSPGRLTPSPMSIASTASTSDAALDGLVGGISRLGRACLQWESESEPEAAFFAQRWRDCVSSSAPLAASASTPSLWASALTDRSPSRRGTPPRSLSEGRLLHTVTVRVAGGMSGGKVSLHVVQGPFHIVGVPAFRQHSFRDKRDGVRSGETERHAHAYSWCKLTHRASQ